MPELGKIGYTVRKREEKADNGKNSYYLLYILRTCVPYNIAVNTGSIKTNAPCHQHKRENIHKCYSLAMWNNKVEPEQICQYK